MAAVLFAFAPLIRALPAVWFGYETYYAHGAVVPLCAAFIVWDRWPRIKNLPLSGSNWAALPLIFLILFMWPTLRSGIDFLMSLTFVAVLLCATWFVAGWRWLRALFVPIAYLLFGLPVFGVIIDRFTQPLQATSRSIAFAMLQLAGQHPIKGDGNIIYLNTYAMDVAVPCSGLKTLLAVTAIVAFFVIVAKLRPWANLALVALVLPLSLLVNGFRIMLIGIVGNYWGDDAAHTFHDYSGYIALVICSVALYYLTRALGWKS
ncbi:MAG: exosortase/archaeosortase family protein [Fimbriimonadaceae bacterium]